MVVRQLIGYGRCEGTKASAALQAIYGNYLVYVNFFQPVRKLVEKRSVDGKTRRRYPTGVFRHRRRYAKLKSANSRDSTQH